MLFSTLCLFTYFWKSGLFVSDRGRTPIKQYLDESRIGSNPAGEDAAVSFRPGAHEGGPVKLAFSAELCCDETNVCDKHQVVVFPGPGESE